MLEKEIANKIQKKLTLGITKKKDRGSMPMLEWYIYINNMRVMMSNLVNYGLYPTPGQHCLKYAPHLYNMFQRRTTSQLSVFKTSFDILFSGIKLTEKIKRKIPITRFTKTPVISGWVLFQLQYLYHVMNNVKLTNKHMFNKGNYATIMVSNRKNPLDNNYLGLKGRPPKKITCIMDLELVNENNTTVLNREQLAFCLFKFEELRNIGTPEVKALTLFEVSVRNNMDSLMELDLSVNVDDDSPSKVKKSGEKMNRGNAVLKTKVRESLSNIGARVAKLKKALRENNDESIQLAIHICDDLQDSIGLCAVENDLGEGDDDITDFDEYMSSYPAEYECELFQYDENVEEGDNDSLSTNSSEDSDNDNDSKSDTEVFDDSVTDVVAASQKVIRDATVQTSVNSGGELTLSYGAHSLQFVFRNISYKLSKISHFQ